MPKYLDLAVALGIRGFLRGSELRARCPLHSDTNPSFSLNTEEGTWICFAGCGSGEFFRLVELTIGATPQEARDWVASNGQQDSLEHRMEQLGSVLNPKSSPDYLPEEAGWRMRYEFFGSRVMPLWFLKRGFEWSTINQWGIKYDHFNDAVIIPIMWQDEFVGTVTRNTRESLPKYRNSDNLPRSEILFGEITNRQPLIILCEGVLDTLWLWQNGYNAGGLLGTYLSQSQVDILKGYRFGEIVLGFDNDEAGVKGMEEAIKLLTKNGWLLPQIKIMVFPEGIKDPQDCSPDQLRDVFENRKELIFT